jgi:hypothetical protein
LGSTTRRGIVRAGAVVSWAPPRGGDVPGGCCGGCCGCCCFLRSGCDEGDLVALVVYD